MTLGEEAGAINLAREADFQLGRLTVSPSTGRVSAAGREQRMQPRVMEVLVLLARSAGRTVTRDELIDACWGGRFVSENAVNRVLAQVRALGRLADPPPFVLETLPKLGVRLIPTPGPEAATSAASSAPADGPAAARPSYPDDRRRRLIPATLAVVALVAAGLVASQLGVWRLGGAAWPGQNGRVEAAGFTASANDAALAEAAAATSDNLIHVLSRSGVTTAGRAGRDEAPARDAELRVAGSVGRVNGSYVFNAQIVDRRSGLVLWDDRILRSPRDVARSPGEPALAIGAILDCAIEDRKAAKTRVSRDAFSLYLYACAGIFLSHDEGQRMLAVTRRLVKAAPRYAGAHAMHAIAAGRIAADTDRGELATALHAEARAAAETALKLDPRTAKAYCGLALNEGVLSNRLKHNWAVEEGYVKKALALDPDLAPARNEYATLLLSTGRLREGIEFIRASSANEDPRQPRDPRTAMLLAAQGDLAAARAELALAEARDGVSRDNIRRTIAYWWEEPKVALAKLRTPLNAQNARTWGCVSTYLKALDASLGAPRHGLPAACNDTDRSTRVRMLARQGDVDGAFAEMNDRMPGGPLLLYYPEMRMVRADPRFWRLAANAGLLAYWQRSGRWPDFCADPGQDCAAAAARALSAGA